MSKENNLAKGVSEPEKVDDFMASLNHPMKDVATYLREVIMSIDKKIGEGIYWNAPTFYYTGTMKPFAPKDYKRYIVGFVFNKKDCIRIVFLRGAAVADPTNLLEGTYTDGRRLSVFTSVDDVKAKEKALKNIIKELIKRIDE